jgi:outer membrane protein assembly factor BamA
VVSIEFAGVTRDRLGETVDELPLKPGDKLEEESLRSTLRQLFLSGIYEDISVEGARTSEGVALLFRGVPRQFVGLIRVEGPSNERLLAQLVHSTKLVPGTRLTDAKITQAQELLKKILAENGFYEAKLSYRRGEHPEDASTDLTFVIQQGVQARVGEVKATGDSGLSAEEFRKRARLKLDSKVDRDTRSRALSGLEKYYQKQKRLEAEINVEASLYQPLTKKVALDFHVERGPVVSVVVSGAKLSSGKLKRLVPVFEEGSVDEDLLNEGSRNLHDYFEHQGYFDAKVSYTRNEIDSGRTQIIYSVELGPRHRVESVKIEGNHYFSLSTIQERLHVEQANAFDHHGVYARVLVQADVARIEELYRNNGYPNAKVTPEIKDDHSAVEKNSHARAELNVLYHIDEGTEVRIGKLEMLGFDQIPVAMIRKLMNSAEGQPVSATNLTGDRDAILGYYLSRGFSHVVLEVTEQQNAADASHMDVCFHVTEGKQFFVRKVLVAGLHYTRPRVVAREIDVHPGAPLDESSLLETQRRLYDLTLFSEVNTSVQNPNGQEREKTVLLQVEEAKRWDLSYGFGFEVQTGTPQRNCPSQGTLNQLGYPNATCSPAGKFGASPRVEFGATRNNLFGRQQQLSLRATYGTLAQRITGSYVIPRFLGSKDFSLAISGGYNNTQDITTYAASRLEASFRVTEHFTSPGSLLSKANTIIYEFSFRRVKVDANTLQVSINQIPLLSLPVRVGGPSITWIRDKRDNPIDAKSGSYLSMQETINTSQFGSQSNFNRMDMTFSTYHGLFKHRWELARSTRFGYERAFGNGNHESIPLPERLYAGGANSHRGFSLNSAGPRDPQTGYPIGGAGVLINSTELRAPAPNLPYVGKSMSMVFFHDMGNVFTYSSDIWPSIVRVRQPNSGSCKNLNTTVTGPITSTGQQGDCSFAYFSHALGMGLRYKTPFGPVRVDFSYNLDPPIFPVIYDYSSANALPFVGQAGHFNFFFSLGQSF